MSHTTAKGRAWHKQRLSFATAVASGTVKCWRCDQLIAPGEPWDLGHPTERAAGGRDADAWPEHRHKTANCEGNRSAGARFGNDLRRFLAESGGQITPPAPEIPPEGPDPAPAGWDERDVTWDACGWLDELRNVPDGGSWPRLMSGPHPEAVGSYGAEAIAWLAAETGLRLRWWQQLALVRQLEHDGDGSLVWLEVLATTARQVGKSVWLRGGSLWRLHQADRFGEEQLVLHTGKDLPVCKEVQRPARVWARGRAELGYGVREQNGNEEVVAPDGSRWIVRGKDSVYGYAATVGIADEAWGVRTELVEDGLEPTMAERADPQMLLASTAHRKASSLFPSRRSAALGCLGAPGSSLLMEWSAPPGVGIDDRAGWRAASPHWSRGRERLLESKLARVLRGESVDPDEPDPVESFRAQYLNQWPVRREALSSRDERLDRDQVWAGAADLTVPVPAGGLVLAVEDFYGRGAAAGVAAQLPDGRVLVFGGLHASRSAACGWVRFLYETHPGSRVLAGASLAADAGLAGLDVGSAGTAQTRVALPLLRQLLADRRLVHDGGSELAGQVSGARVSPGREGGLFVSPRSGRHDLVRCVAWAAAALVQAPPESAPLGFFVY